MLDRGCIDRETGVIESSSVEPSLASNAEAEIVPPAAIETQVAAEVQPQAVTCEEVLEDDVPAGEPEVTVVSTTISPTEPSKEVVEIGVGPDAEMSEEEAAVEQAVSPVQSPGVNVRQIPAYQTMKTVVGQLRSHPSNQYFRQPCREDLRHFCRERGRPIIDFFTISNAITLGQYGLDDPLHKFSMDLKQMWANIRIFYGPQSAETQCVNVLETFSGILLDEWKRKTCGTNSRANKARPNLARSTSTPMSRMEKHKSRPCQDPIPKTQQQAYFASLLAKTNLGPLSSPARITSRPNQAVKRSAPHALVESRPAKKATLSVEQPPDTTLPAEAHTSSEGDAAAGTPIEPKILTRGGARRSTAAVAA